MAHPFRLIPRHYAGGAAGIGRETALQYARSKWVLVSGSESSAVANHAQY